jgi:hypothetical protein
MPVLQVESLNSKPSLSLFLFLSLFHTHMHTHTHFPNGNIRKIIETNIENKHRGSKFTYVFQN